MHKCWSLYNRVDKLRIDDLTKDQVRTILLSIPTSKIGEWYACREGDLHWLPIREIPDFYEDASMVKGEYLAQSEEKSETKDKPVKRNKQEERRPLFEDPTPEMMMTSSTLKLESVPTKERRSARRYVRNLIFYAKHEGRAFECETKDVSMAGISLGEKLPPSFGKTFRAELKLSGGRVKLLVSRVTSSTLKIEESDSWELLRQWIVAW